VNRDRIDKNYSLQGLNIKGDIQSKYVGESETNTRDAFEEAEREEAILIMDEAESLLFNRDRGQRSWELSLTNEFLTSMERYSGIPICTTTQTAKRFFTNWHNTTLHLIFELQSL
jgi:SpoVK/Ycf46/Vps4 family AAA+-type ATPase